MKTSTVGRFLILMTCGCIGAISGCMSEPIRPGAAPGPAVATVDLPPKELFQRIQHILASEPLKLGVGEAADGVILTGYQRFRGEFHIGRHWQERTRYRIAIHPDWNEPTDKSRIEVTAQSEERAAEGQRWDPNPGLHRPQRAQELLDTLVRSLRQ
jgi:hypothetical protein